MYFALGKLKIVSTKNWKNLRFFLLRFGSVNLLSWRARSLVLYGYFEPNDSTQNRVDVIFLIRRDNIVLRRKLGETPDLKPVGRLTRLAYSKVEHEEHALAVLITQNFEGETQQRRFRVYWYVAY